MKYNNTSQVPVEDRTETPSLRAQNQQDSPLLRLPRELRDLIIECTVVEESDVQAKWFSQHKTSFLQICYQLRHEAAETFFSKNIFAIDISFPFWENMDGNHKPWVKKARFVPHLWFSHVGARNYAAACDSVARVKPGTFWTTFTVEDRSDSVPRSWVNGLGHEDAG